MSLQLFKSSFTFELLKESFGKYKFMMRKYFFYFSLTLGLILACSSPNETAKKGFTALEAEALASTRVLDFLENPTLASMETPEDGGGINREGRLAKGEKGKWWFKYYMPGVAQAVLIEVIATKTYEFPSNVESLQGINSGYVDTPDAIAVAEKNGGKNLMDVELITCKLLGDVVWPTNKPTKVAWDIIYKQKNGNRTHFYIEAYSGAFLGKG
jgi:hypothetical protein